MAQTLSTISIACFVLAGLFVLIAVGLFIAFDVKGVYAEIKGKPVVRTGKQPRRKGRRGAKADDRAAAAAGEVPTEIGEEAVTVLANGELDQDSLIDLYEPGTELADLPALEVPTLPDTAAQEPPWPGDAPTDIGEETTVPGAPLAAADEETTLPGEAPTELGVDAAVPLPQQAGFTLQRDILLTDQSRALYQLIE